MRRIAAIAGAAILTLATAHAPLRAQASRVQLEARMDGIFAATDAIHAGLGANVRMGTYLRVGAIGALGSAFDDEGSHPSARIDAAARFLLDPLRQSRWGPYGGGGASLRHESDPGWRGYLLIVLGIDGPTIGGRVDPALEVGLGGGTRVGVVLRGARAGRR